MSWTLFFKLAMLMVLYGAIMCAFAWIVRRYWPE